MQLPTFIGADQQVLLVQIKKQKSVIAHRIKRIYISSQLLTAGIPKGWIASQMGHSNTKMIDENCGKWISKERLGIRSFVSGRLGFKSAVVAT